MRKCTFSELHLKFASQFMVNCIYHIYLTFINTLKIFFGWLDKDTNTLADEVINKLV